VIGGLVAGPVGVVGGAAIGGSMASGGGGNLSAYSAQAQANASSCSAQVGLASGATIEQVLSGCSLCRRKPDGSWARCAAHFRLIDPATQAFPQNNVAQGVEDILAGCSLCRRKPDGSYARCRTHFNLQASAPIVQAGPAYATDSKGKMAIVSACPNCRPPNLCHAHFHLGPL